jgi:hypothetical protein
MRAIIATVRPGPGNNAAYINIDNYATAVLGVQIVTQAGASYSLQHSFDDPNDLINPVPLNSMWWDNSLLPSNIQGISTGNISFQIMAAPLWFRLLLVNGQGLVRVTFAQIGEHSHSNISQGPFAPPPGPDQGLPFGDNYRAMAK